MAYILFFIYCMSVCRTIVFVYEYKCPLIIKKKIKKKKEEEEFSINSS